MWFSFFAKLTIFAIFHSLVSVWWDACGFDELFLKLDEFWTLEFWYAPNLKSFFSSWPFGRHAYQKVTVFWSFFSCASWDRNSETFFDIYLWLSNSIETFCMCFFEFPHMSEFEKASNYHWPYPSSHNT